MLWVCPRLWPAPLSPWASAINGSDYYASGRTLEKLGMSGMNAEQINQFLQEGSL